MPEFTKEHTSDIDIEALIPKMKRWKSVSFYNTAISDEALETISKHAKNLQEVSISSKNITDHGIEYLSGIPSITSMLIHSGPMLSDHSVECISSLCQLREMYVDDTSITDHALDNLVFAESLWSVSAMNTSVSDRFVNQLSANEKLKLINLKNTLVSGSGLVSLPDNPNSTLYIDGCPISELELKSFLSSHSNYRTLGIGCNGATDAVLKLLADNTNIEELRIEKSSVTSSGILELAGHPSLCVIYASKELISQEVCDVLESTSPVGLIIYRQ